MGEHVAMINNRSGPPTCNIVLSCSFGCEVVIWEKSICSSLPNASTLSIATGLRSKSTCSGGTYKAKSLDKELEIDSYIRSRTSSPLGTSTSIAVSSTGSPLTTA